MKIEGDGAPVSRQTNFCLLSAAVLDDQDNIFSAVGREILACVAGHEGYQLWKTCAADNPDIIKAVNALVRDPYVTIDGETYEVELYLGGDYKMLLCVMGMNAACAHYACLFCYIHAVSSRVV